MSASGVLKSVREDDFLEYFLFPTGLDQKDVSLENSEPLLECLQGKVNKLAKDFCQRYIWHRDEFKVAMRKGDLQQRMLIEANGFENENVQLPPHLHGITHYGDNVQDEWFIVSLLFHLTRQIPELVVRVVDSDGEFLLIEAAEHLPRWANPDRCEGRVFICDGELHLVGTEDQNEAFPMERVFRELSSESRSKWVVSKSIQTCIDERIRDFPEKIGDNLHRATLYVPVGVAAVLEENPRLISAAVLAFCNRDPIDLKVCRAMRYFPPESCVYTSVVFTRCLYAMLLHSNYLPDRRTGWSLPLASDANYKAYLLGLKLACGFEILASQARSASSLETDKGWKNYFESLKSKGYFQENIEGSQEYVRLLNVAQSYYRDHSDSMKFTPKIGEEIVSILKRNDYDAEELRKQGLDLPTPDDDSWINVSPEELDEILTKRYGSRKLFSLNGNVDAQEFSSMVSDFLDKKSEFDGVDQTDAQVDPLSPVRPKRTKSKSKTDVQPIPPPLHQPIDFDPDAFGAHVKNLLDLVIPEDRWDSSDNSDMSDYGEEDYDQNIEEMSPTRSGRAAKNAIQTYMDQMDRELAQTTIGKSFETELGGAGPETRTDSDDFDDIESFKPVNIDVNTLRNMMESYQAQIGGPGPAANLLGSMGVQISRASNGETSSGSNAQRGSTQQTDV
ncbi:protein ecdysoneless [Sabethes cyaneus]|uniref:protein ecdysoneless n=1 Tax=Sabethes cyaneus TaxID=53552 RepID=UPI00237E572A|nr:protein ecdysoneless [Sabethes cyaneus]XP_053685129.1 protein ecdysoneless [Sabethes cyaneus]